MWFQAFSLPGNCRENYLSPPSSIQAARNNSKRRILQLILPILLSKKSLLKSYFLTFQTWITFKILRECIFLMTIWFPCLPLGPENKKRPKNSDQCLKSRPVGSGPGRRGLKISPDRADSLKTSLTQIAPQICGKQCFQNTLNWLQNQIDKKSRNYSVN